jgi:hypothetical protein
MYSIHKTNERIGRPRNAFFIFKSLNRDVVIDAFIKTEKRMPLPTEIISAAAVLWNALDDSERCRYRSMAEIEKSQFLKLHPGYKFKRRPTEEVLRRSSSSKIIF